MSTNLGAINSLRIWRLTYEFHFQSVEAFLYVT